MFYSATQGYGMKNKDVNRCRDNHSSSAYFTDSVASLALREETAAIQRVGCAQHQCNTTKGDVDQCSCYREHVIQEMTAA